MKGACPSAGAGDGPRGTVNSAPGFSDQPKVINGFSDLLVLVFGARGQQARSAVGMAALPFNIPVEVEMTVEVR